ncbi:MAG: HNH endonuclease [Gordonia sp. (in: high G+C Gram-positive bacteria)]
MPRRFDWTWPEIVVAAGILEEAGWGGTIRASDRRAIELSDLLRSVNPELALDPTFRSANSVQRKLEDLRTARPGNHQKTTKGGRPTLEVAAAFSEDATTMSSLAAQFRAEPRLLALSFAASKTDEEYVDLDDDDASASAFEGAVARRIVAHRERDPKLRRKKIAQSRQDRGSISCETCGFDFEETYGELGHGYTHVHHIVPLHVSGPVITDLDDLVLVCANCHAMVHRRKPWMMPEEMRELLAELDN